MPQLHKNGFWFSDRRREKGLTQAALAKLVGKDRSYITQIERGQRWPSRGTLISILGALDVDPADAIKTLHLVENEDMDRMLRFLELLEEVKHDIPPERFAEFAQIFQSPSDAVQLIAQLSMAASQPAAPLGWLDLDDEDRRLVQRVVNRLLDSYQDEEE